MMSSESEPVQVWSEAPLLQPRKRVLPTPEAPYAAALELSLGVKIVEALGMRHPRLVRTSEVRMNPW